MSVGERLNALGQSLWMDVLSRELLQSGELDRLIAEDGVSGVTTNPTILGDAIASGRAYDEQLTELLRAGATPQEAYESVAIDDVRDACDRLLPWHSRSDGLEGFVSLEVDPRLADDTDRTVAEATRLYHAVDRPNLLIKIPATAAGVGAVEDMIARGISVNVTLVFARDRHAACASAYIRGLTRFAAAGGNPGSVACVSSFFVSRVDVEADAHLTAVGADPDLRGRLGIENARLAFAYSAQLFGSDAFQGLAAAGGRPQRLLWASTSVKDPSYRDVRYVEELIGANTITTVPLATLRAFADHGRVTRSLSGGVGGARRFLARLAATGLDYGDLTRHLERDGVERFVTSYTAAVAHVAAHARTAKARS
jgi:transaldolase/transaldolase/glucose-6-phosphate isomerase